MTLLGDPDRTRETQLEEMLALPSGDSTCGKPLIAKHFVQIAMFEIELTPNWKTE
jgi:hypothetical protein